MNPLSKEARAALQALEANEPSAAEERRVREHLERALGVAIPVATVAAATTATSAMAAQTTASAATSGAVTFGVGAKVALFVAAVSVGSVMTYGVKAVVSAPSRSRDAVASVSPARGPVVEPRAAPAVVVEPAPDPTPELPVADALPIAAAPVEATAAPKQNPPKPHAVAKADEPKPPVTPAEPVALPPPPVVSLEDAGLEPTSEADYELVVELKFAKCDTATEMRSAVAARQLLLENHPEHALWQLGAYQKYCPSGRWSDEAWRVRLASLCKLGRNKEASALLEWFTTEYPLRRSAIEAVSRGYCEPEVFGD